MCQMLLSINPQFVERIFTGEKQYEYRKIRCKEEIDKIIIYATSPVMSVVGEVEVIEILEATPDKIWKKTKKKSGVSKIFYDEYYKSKEKAVAYRLGKVTKYKEPKNLIEYGVKVAPQSFVYI